MAANLFAQESYVVDSACVGAERLYRRDGEKAYAYDWFIRDTSGLVVANPAGVDFVEVISPGDTVWGNEIQYLWDVVGEFDIEVQVFTEHGCDTISSGRMKVFDLPGAVAGPGLVFCSLGDIAVQGDSAWHHSIFYWATTGDGFFDDEYAKHPTYHLGPNDSLNMQVTLFITAEGLADNGTCEPAVDSVTYQFSEPDIEFTVFDLLCYNDSNAVIETNIVGGMPPYAYQWKGPAGFNPVDAGKIKYLGAGWYVLKVIDANNCYDIDSVEIVNPPRILISIDDIQHVSCFGYNDGLITASASGGTGGLWFTWVNSKGFPFFGNTINNLPADTYVVTVIDENNCKVSDTVVVSEPDSMLALIVGTDTLCEGDITTLLGTTVGGTGTLLHSWSGSGPAYLNPINDTTYTFGAAPQGTYPVIYQIEDQLGCQASDTLDIVVYPPTFSTESMEICAGETPFTWNHRLVVSDRDSIYQDTLVGANQFGCDSILTMDVKVLFPSYQYDTLFVCANEEPFVQHTQLIQPGIDSAYLDTVKYTSSGCDSLYIALQVYTLPVTYTLLDSTLCAGAPEFMWNNRFIETTRDSIYLDTLKNTFGCDSLLTYDIKILPPDTTIVDTFICQDAPVFVWNSVSIETYKDSIYEARLDNMYGCDSLVLLNVQLWPTTDTLLETMICEGAPSFMWNNRLIVSTRDSIYLDTLVNTYGCDSLLTYDVQVIPPDTSYVFDTLCQNDPGYVWNGITIQTEADSVYEAHLQNMLTCDSTVFLAVSILRGIVIDTFVEACETYTWPEGTGATYTASGIYDHIIGAAACADTLRLHLLISPTIVLNADVSDVRCYGDANGAIDLTVSGGIPPYKYEWNTGVTTEDLSSIPAGTYSVTVYDSLDCSNFIEVEVVEPAEIVAAIDSVTPAAFPGDPSGSIWVSVSDGTPGYTFEWTDNVGNFIGNQEDLLNQPKGAYSLLIIDNKLCQATLVANIPVKDTSGPGPYQMDCPASPLLTCFEELAANPMANTLAEYLALEPGLDVYSDCGLLVSSFNSRDSVVDASAYCYEEYRFYSILDSCGNELSCIQQVIVNDTEAPQISCPPVLPLTNTSAPAPYTFAQFIAAGGAASDNCSIVRFKKVNEISSGTAFNQIITRTYEVEDYCGNINSCEHIITITNTAQLAITCPPPIPLCPNDPVPAAYNSLSDFIAAGGDTASTMFPVVPSSWQWLDDVSDNNSCPEIIARTYTISNTNGETATCEQLIIREDTQAPTLNIPSRSFNSCFSNTNRYTDLNDLKQRNPGASWSDNCQIVRLVLVRENTSGTCPEVITRTYRAYDACDNPSLDETHTITIYDEEPPTVSDLPPLITNDCTLPDPVNDINVFKTQGVTFFELCNNPIRMDYVGSIPGGPSEPNVLYYQYRFADACDNGVVKLQKVFLNGFTAPTFDPIGPLCQFSTAPALPLVSHEGITGKWGPATINTDSPGTTTYLFTPDPGQCASPTSMVVVVTPEIQLSETHVDIGLNPNPIGAINLTVSDGTAPYNFLWSNGATTPNLSGLEAGSYSVHVTDAIGCEADRTVLIKSDGPVMSCAPDSLVECPDLSEIPPYATYAEYQAAGGSATATARLDTASFAFVREDTLTTTYCLTVERTYTIKDLLGNKAFCTQIINVEDLVPPTIICPEDGSAVCLTASVADINTLEDFERNGGIVDDNCEVDRSSFTYTRTPTKQIDKTEIVTEYFISDLCGNISSCTQTFILTDTIPPEAVCNDITVYLDENGNYLMTEIDMDNISAGSSDNCTAFEDLIIDVIPSEFTCEDVEFGKQVMVVVTDEAGNSDDCEAHVTVVDNMPPDALCKPLTIYLDEYGQARITNDMIDNGSYDNCSDVTLELDKYDFDCQNLGDNTVNLTVKDQYGLESSCATTVSVLDTISPQVSCIVRDTIQLSEEDGSYILAWDMVTTSEWDNCEIVMRELSKDTLFCTDIGLTEITATVIDQSGNSNYCTAEFVVIGNTPPNVANDSAITAVNIPVEINVVLNDYDLKTNINLATLSIINGPGNGSVVVDNKTGIVTYTPDAGFVGNDIFRYSICDDGVPCIPECGEAIVFVKVRPANNPPNAENDYFDLPCGELTGNVRADNGNGADSDPDGNGTLVELLVQATNGIAMLYESGDFEYTPNVDFTEGIDSFRYILYDDGMPALSDTAWVYITRVADNDCDGVADVDDIDDDNDGIRDVNEGFNETYPALSFDSDQDGIPDYFDIDSDNDGILDNIEGQAEDNYIEPVSWRDDNHNGWDKRYDNDEGGYPFDLGLTDTDGDGTPDFLDTDSDNDGVYDFIEGSDDNADGLPDIIRYYSDLDRDGLDDAYDWIDGWGNFIDNETGSLAPLQDFDGDGARDWRDVNDEDDKYLTYNEDINGDGNYSNDDLDLDGHPEYLDTEMDCELFIPEGFSPNDDGVHDFFQVLCIYPRYPDAKLMIFNRNGQLLFQKEHYGNYDYWGWNEAWWWGNSENRFTIGRAGGLPAGNYIYVLELNDGAGDVRNGTVMVAY